MRPKKTPDELRAMLTMRSVRNDETGCLEWAGARNARGYGITKHGRQFWRAHRLAYTLAYGPIPEDVFICHACDNPSCVEVAHLYAGSHTENMLDRAQKGRNGRPTKAGKVLGWDAVLSIRRKHAAGQSRASLCAEYGCSPTCVGSIIRGDSWNPAHAPEIAPTMRHSRPANTILTEKQVMEMRSRYTRGEKCKAMAKEFGIHFNTALQAVTGATWRNLPMPKSPEPVGEDA